MAEPNPTTLHVSRLPSDPHRPDDYRRFLAAKHVAARPSGFEPGELPSALFPFQRDVTRWAVRQGRAGAWLATGLGKTFVQLSFSDQVCKHTGGKALILCPLAVARQTAREAARFGIETPVKVCRQRADVIRGINVTNYQMLKHFDASEFACVVVDESDILADFTGATKRMILDRFRDTPYKLDCSATPAPNDPMEIGNHADFLGVMPSSEMLSRWFINDTSEAGKYRLKDHGRDDFWRWVASWACAVTLPSDLGHEDGAYLLPPLEIEQRVVHGDILEGREDGFLLRMPRMSATSMHGEMRRTVTARVDEALDILDSIPSHEPAIVWCHTDAEADELRGRVPDAVEIRGSYPAERKESLFESWMAGNARTLITKPSMFGHGLNLQRCAYPTFVGLDYSFKGFFQAIRRCWRFGQTRPVRARVIVADTEGRLLEVLRAKQDQYDDMTRSMVAAIGRHGLGGDRRRRELSNYRPDTSMTVPSWLGGSS